MSLTIIAFAVGAALSIIGAAVALAGEEFGSVSSILGCFFIAVAVGAFVIAIGSYNNNIRESKERDKVACVEQGKEILRYNAGDYCVEPGSKIIRTF